MFNYLYLSYSFEESKNQMSINKKSQEIFGISNFKPFRTLQELDLAPITLIYGQNSGGKSSLLEALLCTNQSLEDNQIEKGVFNLSGKNSNSGTYASVVNKFSKDNFIYLKFKPSFTKIQKNRGNFYLNSLEPILSPEIILHIKNKDENKASSKLFIKKIELIYGSYLKGLNFIFESDGNEELIVISRQNENGLEAFPHKFEGCARYKLKNFSKEKFKKFEELALKEISNELNSFLKNNENSDNLDINLTIPSLDNTYARMRFFPKESISSYTGLLKVASIYAGGWITERRPGLVLNKIISNEKTNPFNGEFKKFLEDHSKNINNKFLDHIEKNKIDISLYIESSSSKNKKNAAERVSLNFIYQNQKFTFKELIKNNNIFDTFSERLKSHFQYQESEEIKEIEKTINITEVSSLRLIDSLMLLKDMFNDFKEIDKGDKNYKKYINQIYSEINIIKNNLYELKLKYDECYQKIYEPFNKNNLQLSFETDKFFNNVPILGPKFDKEIIYICDDFKDKAGSIEEVIFPKKLIEGFTGFIDSLIINLESLYLELYYETNAIKTNKLIKDQESNLKNENIKSVDLFDCISWLNNNSKQRFKEFDWADTKNFSFRKYGKSSLRKYIRQEYSCLPFIPTNLFPLFLSSEIIHLGPARSEGLRVYDINDINKLGKADCAYLLKLNDFKKYRDQIDEILQKSKIANGIDINNLSNIMHDLKEIIIYPLDENKITTKDPEKGVNIVDTGYGISQILPIIINSVLKEANTILVQQPETHLHPRLQAEVGTIISKSLKRKRDLFLFGNQKNWIIETHSETLLFRLLKEIREGNIENSDLNVFYIDHDKEKGSSIKKMLISENGELISQWPNGFFSTDIEEIFD